MWDKEMVNWKEEGSKYLSNEIAELLLGLKPFDFLVYPFVFLQLL